MLVMQVAEPGKAANSSTFTTIEAMVPIEIT
jgi:hypothetical protein